MNAKITTLAGIWYLVFSLFGLACWNILCLIQTFLEFTCRYKVEYITSEKAYLLCVNFSACFETNGDCMLNFPIMTNTRIPLLDCDFKNQSFAIPGWSILSLQYRHILKITQIVWLYSSENLIYFFVSILYP